MRQKDKTGDKTALISKKRAWHTDPLFIKKGDASDRAGV